MTRRHAFLTPDSLEGSPVCYPLAIPESLYLYVQGALLPLSLEHNWEEHGDVTPDEAAQYWLEKLEGLNRAECEPMNKLVGKASRINGMNIGHNSITTITFESVALDSEYITHSSGEFEIVKPGWYSFTFNGSFASGSTTGDRYFFMAESVNGWRIGGQRMPAVASAFRHISWPARMEFEEEQIFAFYAYQNSGGSLSIPDSSLVPILVSIFYHGQQDV